MGFLNRLFGRAKKSENDEPAVESKPVVKAEPDFPLGENHIDDPDIKTFADLGIHYPLPHGYEYRQDAQGVPCVFRPSDEAKFKMVIEEGLLTIDEPFTRKDGKIGYKTTEVFKKSPR